MTDLWKESVAANFGAADCYDDHASLQREVARRLVVRLAGLALPENPQVVEIGCGTGFLSEKLVEIVDHGSFLFTDLAPPMVARCRRRLADSGRGSKKFMVMDGEQPTLTGKVDLITASLAFQWFSDLPAALTKLKSLLAPGGIMVFATLGAETFREWRSTLQDMGEQPGTPTLPSSSELKKMLAAGGRVEEEFLVNSHSDRIAFFRSLKGVGATHSAPNYQPLSVQRFKQGLSQWNGEATWHLLYGYYQKDKDS